MNPDVKLKWGLDMFFCVCDYIYDYIILGIFLSLSTAVPVTGGERQVF